MSRTPKTPPRAGQWALVALLSLSPFVGSAASAGTVYFEVAEPAGRELHRDSFVLPLTDAAHIAHARDLVANGPDAAGEPIVFAKIAAGADGINRNLLASDQPAWSWHVTEFDGFGDFGIELIDSWPTYVEDHLPQWLTETGGSIGFWSYTVVRELPDYPAAVPGPPNGIPLPAALPAGLALLGALAGVRVWRSSRAIG